MERTADSAHTDVLEANPTQPESTATAKGINGLNTSSPGGPDRSDSGLDIRIIEAISMRRVINGLTKEIQRREAGIAQRFLGRWRETDEGTGVKVGDLKTFRQALDTRSRLITHVFVAEDSLAHYERRKLTRDPTFSQAECDERQRIATAAQEVLLESAKTLSGRMVDITAMLEGAEDESELQELSFSWERWMLSHCYVGELG